MHITLERVEQTAHNITTFWFQPEKPMRYDAGQFIELTLKHDNADSRGQKRWFTLSSSPTETPLIAVTTKFAPANGSTYKQELQKLQPGSVLDVSSPMGDFVLPRDARRPLLFIAGGIGITPFRSIIKSLIDSAEHRDITLIYSVHNENELAFSDLLSSYNLNVQQIVTDPSETWKGLDGPVTAARVAQLDPDFATKMIYMSGPEPMIENMVADFRKSGLPDHQLVGDYFPNYPPPDQY